MNIQTKKLHLIQEFLSVESEEIIDELEAVLSRRRAIDPVVQKEMMERARRSEEDIKEGRVYTADEAEARINQRFDL
ncbi:MAG: hypothetical protein RIG77_12050 [Cyclobacteriaceae bacterium]